MRSSWGSISRFLRLPLFGGGPGFVGFNQVVLGLLLLGGLKRALDLNPLESGPERRKFRISDRRSAPKISNFGFRTGAERQKVRVSNRRAENFGFLNH